MQLKQFYSVGVAWHFHDMKTSGLLYLSYGTSHLKGELFGPFLATETIN